MEISKDELAEKLSGFVAADGEVADPQLVADYVFAELHAERQAAAFAASRAQGRDVVESAARALIGIPDII